ncbi:MAG TPA: AMP-binding protein [Thermodesulfobacteriota bacterium]|nr:AMP-binding protein [Thermodesulfobacteriota bacterium]
MDSQSQNHRIEEVIKRIAYTDPAAPAIVSSKYNPFSYSQLVWQIDHVAGVLSKSGLRRSARIAISVKDTATAALAIVAVACSASAIPLDQNLAESEIETRLKLLDVDAVCVFVGENTVTRSVAEKQGIAIIELMPQDKYELAFSMVDPKIPPKNQLDDPTLDSVAVIFQTSGTTAEPKLVPCLHSGLLATAERTRTWFNLNKHDRCLSIMPPYFSHGLTFTILAPFLSGGSVAFPASHTQVNLAEWFGELKPTWFSASPTTHLAISEMLGSTLSGLKHNLRMAVAGGAQLPESVRSSLQLSLGIPVFAEYGMTETSQISANLPAPGLYKSGTVGIPPSDTVIVAGPDGTNVPKGEKGEILVRGQNVMKGYLNGPELNQAAFSQGWFRTGDIGSFDEEGFLMIHGRIKELISRGGEKISPFEIERVLLTHPDVLEAVAFAVPHPRLGEDVGAAVVLRPGATVAAEEFRQLMSSQLSWNKVPRRVHIRESIPKGPGGKALRKKLSEVCLFMSSEEQANLSDVVLGKELLGMWRRLLQNDNLTIDDDFFECGGDSLLAIELLLEVEQLTGKTLPSSTIFETGTVRKLLKRVTATDKVQPQESVLVGSEQGKIIHFFHGDFTYGGVAVKTFSKMLGTDYLINAIPPHLPHEGKWPDSIEDMAKEKLQKILERQPNGPYVLLGHCNGALVAFEAARLLVSMGKEVKAVVMVDPIIMSVRRSAQFIFTVVDFVMRLMGVQKNKRRKPLIWIHKKLLRMDRMTKDFWRRALFFFQKTGHQKRSSGKKMKNLFSNLRHFQKFSPEWKEHKNIRQHYDNAFFDYKPLSLNVPVLYISGQFSGGAWRRIAEDTVYINISRGNHGSLRGQSYAQSVVDKIRDLINR